MPARQNDSALRRRELGRWELERRAALADFMDALDVGTLDLGADPLAFLPHLDHFVAGQDYDGFDQDDWLYLHTMIAAYIAEVLIRRYGTRWRLRHDSRGPNYMLVATGHDGREYEVSPLDVVHEGLKEIPPKPTHMLANAELAAHVVPGYP